MWYQESLVFSPRPPILDPRHSALDTSLHQLDLPRLPGLVEPRFERAVEAKGDAAARWSRSFRIEVVRSACGLSTNGYACVGPLLGIIIAPCPPASTNNWSSSSGGSSLRSTTASTRSTANSITLPAASTR